MLPEDGSAEKRILTISASTFIIMLGAGIVVPILPKYAGTFGASYTYVGFTISAFGLARILTDIPSGTLSDKVGRRTSLLVGTILFVASGLLAAFSTSIGYLIAARFVQGVGAAIYTTSALAYVAEIVPATRKGRYLGYYQSSFFLGSAFGPSIGGVLTSLGGLRLPFFTLSALSFVAALATSKGVTTPTVRERIVYKHRSISSMVTDTIKSKSMIISCVAAATTFILTTAIRFTILPIYSEKELNLNEVEIGLVLTIIASVNFFMMRWAGSISDKVGAVLTMIYGFTLSGLTIILYAYSFNLLTLLVIASAFGVTTSLIMPAQISLAVESSDPEHRGLSMGVYRIFSDVGLVVGPLLSGVLIEFLPLAYAFYFIAGLCFSTALFIYLAH